MDIAKTAAWIRRALSGRFGSAYSGRRKMRRAHRQLCVETMMIMDILQFFDIVMNMIKGDF